MVLRYRSRMFLYARAALDVLDLPIGRLTVMRTLGFKYDFSAARSWGLYVLASYWAFQLRPGSEDSTLTVLDGGATSPLAAVSATFHPMGDKCDS